MRCLLGILIALSVVNAGEASIQVDILKARIAAGEGSTRDLQNICRELKVEKKGAEALAFMEATASEHSDADVKACAMCLSIPLLVKAGNVSKAIAKGDYVINNFKQTQWAKECLYTVGEIYRDLLEDEDTAEGYFARLKKE